MLICKNETDYPLIHLGNLINIIIELNRIDISIERRMIMKHRKLSITIVFMFYLCFQPVEWDVSATAPIIYQAQREKEAGLSANHPLVHIPFTFDGRIVIPVSIKGLDDVGVILDSGFPQKNMMLLMHNELGKQLGLEYAQTQNLARGGGSGAAKPVHLAPGVNVTISHIDLGSMIIGVLDESRETSVFRNQGVFGDSVFLPYVVKVDFDASELILYDPKTYQPEKGWEEIPLHLSERNLPLIEASIKTEELTDIPVKLILDTGGKSNMILITDEGKQITHPSKMVYGLSGIGLRGDVFANMGRIPELKMGSVQLRDVIVDVFNKQEIIEKIPVFGEIQCDGVIGIGCMYRFNMIFDYTHSRLFIKPNTFFLDVFDLNMAGMVIEKMGRGDHVVHYVMDGSPASEQGIQKNDVVEEVNSKHIDDFDYLELKKAFEQENETVTIGICRDGKRRTIQLKLERII